MVMMRTTNKTVRKGRWMKDSRMEEIQLVVIVIVVVVVVVVVVEEEDMKEIKRGEEVCVCVGVYDG